MEQNIFFSSTKTFGYKNFFFFLIFLHLTSSSVYNWIALSITGNFMLNNKSMEWLVVTNIFDRNIAGKK